MPFMLKGDLRIMNEMISSFFILMGSLFVLISAIGLLRMPDILLRMSATTKAATLGVGSILIGTAIHFWDIGITARAIVIVTFLFITAPLAAHMIGRAAYYGGIKLWKGTKTDELREKMEKEQSK